MMDCPLCTSKSDLFFSGQHGGYYSCPFCLGVFLSAEDLPDEISAKARYEQHNNDVNDIGYQRFVSPIVDHVRANFNPADIGLDFGCGTGPVISFLLEQNGFSVKKFDPLFSPDRTVLSALYDYIVCCEVVEHFHKPAKVFQLLRSLLKNNAQLICMTQLMSDDRSFEGWHYKDDPTHVFFYRRETINFIQNQFGFKRFDIWERMVVFMA